MSVSRQQKFLFGAFLLLVSVVTSVFAATVTINTDNRVEFGQSLYQVGACDSFVDISAESDGTNITEIIIDGFEIRNCPDTYVRIKFYDSTTTAMTLYQESSTAVNRILLYVNGQRGRFAGLDFLNSQGLVPNPYSECVRNPLYENCKSDGYLDLDYYDGRYRLNFASPRALSQDFNSFTVETSDEIFTP